MRNRYPGVCSCGKKVGAEKGTLGMVDGNWIVICSGCPKDGTGAASKPKRTRKKTASTAFWATKKKKATVYKRSTGTRKFSKKKKVAREFREAPEPDWSLNFMPTVYDALTADGQLCTKEYARVAKDVVGMKDKDRELELLVALVEMRALGHLAA